MKRTIKRQANFALLYCAARLVAAIFRTDGHTNHENRWLAQRVNSVLGSKFLISDIELIRDALSAAYYKRYARVERRDDFVDVHME